LHRTLNILGCSVNECPAGGADVVFEWSAKGLSTRVNGDILIMEHGWIPRWSYQISDLGTNSRGHYARCEYKPLNDEERLFISTYLQRLIEIYRRSVDGSKVSAFMKDTPGEFILVPFQLATDFNLKHSGTQFEKFYSDNPENNVQFAQACIDYAEELKLPLPVIFKQHPQDRTPDLDRLLRIRNKANRLLTNNRQMSAHEIFASGRCKLVIGINSNTLHEAAVWNIQSICLGTLIWDEKTSPRPFLADIGKAGHLIGTRALDNEATLAYMCHVVKNQWFLSDFQNPLIVEEIMRSKGRCEPFGVRKKYSLS
ncbi:MAG: polysialyltransferase family glycosyltransferase, partial [bacterium]